MSEQGSEGAPDTSGWEQNPSRAEEMAYRMDPYEIQAKYLKTVAKEKSGDEDPEKSTNPLVCHLIKRIRELGNKSLEEGETAGTEHDKRQSLILESTTDLMDRVLERSTKMQGEGRGLESRIDFNPPMDQASELGLNQEEFRSAYMKMVYLQLGVEAEAAESLLAEASKREAQGQKTIKTIIPNVMIGAGRRSMGATETELYIRVTGPE